MPSVELTFSACDSATKSTHDAVTASNTASPATLSIPKFWPSSTLLLPQPPPPAPNPRPHRPRPSTSRHPFRNTRAPHPSFPDRPVSPRHYVDPLRPRPSPRPPLQASDYSSFG